MKIMKMGELLSKAQSNHYGIGSFSPRNTFLIEYVLKAAEEEKSPLLVQISANEFRWFDVNPAEFGKRFYEIAGNFTIPAGLHLDHTKDIEVIKKAIDSGFTSVMIDASDKEFGENIRITKEVVEYAHSKGVDVEAELGRIGTADKIEVENSEELYTNPDDAKRFVGETNVDALAVSVGTAHGVYPVKDPKIDFERIKQIRSLVNVPLVLHGASGLPAHTVRKAIELEGGGVSKINIATDLEQAFLKAIGSSHRLLNKEIWQLNSKTLNKGGEAVQKVVEEKIKLYLGSNGKASDFLK